MFFCMVEFLFTDELASFFILVIFLFMHILYKSKKKYYALVISNHVDLGAGEQQEN